MARIVSFTQLNMINRCKWKWGIKYRLGLTAREVSAPMRLGGLLHDALAYWYSTGTLDWPAIAASGRHEREIDVEIEDEAKRIMELYVEENPIEQERQLFEVLAVEWPFTVPVRALSGYPAGYRLIGWVDMIVRDSRGLWLWDHKSGKSFPSSAAVVLDYQLTTYAWALREMGAPIAGVVLNLLPTTKKPQFRRDRLLKLPRELDNWGRVLYNTCRDIPPPRIPWNRLPRSPLVRNCPWDCDMYELCRLDVEGQTEAFNDIIQMDYTKRKVDRSSKAYLRHYNRRIPKDWRASDEQSSLLT